MSLECVWTLNDQGNFFYFRGLCRIEHVFRTWTRSVRDEQEVRSVRAGRCKFFATKPVIGSACLDKGTTLLECALESIELSKVELCRRAYDDSGTFFSHRLLPHLFEVSL